MKRLLIVAALCALLILCVVPNTQAGSGWSSSVSPSFAFNGDSVTLTVTGIPGNFAFIKIRLGNETMDDRLVFLDDMGKGSVNWSVPILAQTGTYTFLVVANGVNVTSATVSIVFDDVTYLRWRVENVEKRNDQLSEMVGNVQDENDQTQGMIFPIWLACTIGVAATVFNVFVLFLFYLPAFKQRMDDWRFKDGLKGRMSTFYKTYIDPAPDGWMYRAVPTLDIEAERQKDKRKRRTFKPHVIIPTDDGLGFIQADVEIEGTKKEVPPEAEPEIEKVKKDGKMNFIGRLRAKREAKKVAPKTSETVPKEDYLELLKRLDKPEEERMSRTPERVYRSPTPSVEVGTTPEKPQDAVPIVIEEEVLETPVNAPKPRRKPSSKPRSTKPRAKKAESIKEVVE